MGVALYNFNSAFQAYVAIYKEKKKEIPLSFQRCLVNDFWIIIEILEKYKLLVTTFKLMSTPQGVLKF